MMFAGTVTAFHDTADLLALAEQRLPAVDPGATAFGATGLGLLGEVGREAYQRWREATEARVQEARAHARRVRELAELLGHATGGFRDAQESVRRGHRELDDTDGIDGAGVS
jgi:hypothetical protein